MRGANLDKHLSKVHPETGAGATAATLRFGGKDRALGRGLFGALLVSVACAVVVIVLKGPELSTATTAAIGIPVVVLLFAALTASFDLLPARLELKDDRVTLRYALGVVRRSAPLPKHVEVGKLWTVRPSAIMPGDGRGEKVAAGFYLRLSRSPRITVGCPKGIATRKHWAPGSWRDGRKTRFWDITLDRTTMVELEYALAARGVLVPRQPGAAEG